MNNNIIVITLIRGIIMFSSKNSSADKGFEFTYFFKGILWAVGFAFIGIVILTVCLSFFDMSDLTIKIINQIIKVIAIFIGCKKCIKEASKGLVKGCAIGGFVAVIAIFLFSLLTLSFNVTGATIMDILFSSGIGALCGVLTVNLSK